VKIGVTLPTLSSDAGGVLDAAREAERAGLHGVFCFDHLWPLGHPERPALSLYPMLGAVGASTARIRVCTFVARIGLLPDQVVAASIESLHASFGDRLIAGLGTGDEASAPEHARNGLPYLGTAARLRSLAWALQRLSEADIECWVGAGNDATNQVARDAGASLNFWGASPARVAREVARSTTPVTWGGPLPASSDAAADALRALGGAGASWVVWGWPRSIDLVTEAAAKAGVELAPPPATFGGLATAE
jgi:alkanesulfonate monooxygenase SsuD/methylene tetrahydromethanopterin reductase-like flavin-dependent oxidoreductase (luciferase family)